MSRVYRALEKAEREKQDRLRKDSTPETLPGEPLPLMPEKETPLWDPEGGNGNSKSPSSRPILVASSHSFASEQFRKLRTHIFLRSPAPRCLLITSAAPQEGKTMVAVNLAMAIAKELHKKAILIDADLRKPGIFPDKYKGAKGLAEYLAEQIPFTDILKPFETNHFMIIPAGSPSPKSAELIGSAKMKDLLKTLQGAEDTYILIDSPPLLSASESLLLAEWADGVLLVVKGGAIPRGAIRRMVDTIGRQRILGVVFNQKDLKTDHKNYDYYHRCYRQ